MEFKSLAFEIGAQVMVPLLTAFVNIAFEIVYKKKTPDYSKITTEAGKGLFINITYWLYYQFMKQMI